MELLYLSNKAINENLWAIESYNSDITKIYKN